MGKVVHLRLSRGLLPLSRVLALVREQERPLTPGICWCSVHRLYRGCMRRISQMLYSSSLLAPP